MLRLNPRASNWTSIRIGNSAPYHATTPLSECNRRREEKTKAESLRTQAN